MNDPVHVGSPICLTIAGFDPSGGAGVIADCQTFTAFNCIPTAAVTTLTFQNDRAVMGASHQSGETVLQQIRAITANCDIAAVKTGLLPTPEIVHEVGELFRRIRLPSPVVDPVLQSSSGFQLMEVNAVAVLLSELMPLACVITPNIAEAEQLTGLEINDENGMREAARNLRELGARAVLIKGGHLKQGPSLGHQQSEAKSQAIDILDDGGTITVFRGEWIDGPPLRGTGCILSAAIASGLANGSTLKEAVRCAKEFVAQTIRQSSKLVVSSNPV